MPYWPPWLFHLSYVLSPFGGFIVIFSEMRLTVHCFCSLASSISILLSLLTMPWQLHRCKNRSHELIHDTYKEKISALVTSRPLTVRFKYSQMLHTKLGRQSHSSQAFQKGWHPRMTVLPFIPKWIWPDQKNLQKLRKKLLTSQKLSSSNSSFKANGLVIRLNSKGDLRLPSSTSN